MRLRLLLGLALILCVGQVQAQEYPGYVELKSFTTNFGQVQSGPLRFVKAEVTLQVAENGSRLDVDKHLPHIRNELVFLFLEQGERDLSTIESQSLLAQKALNSVQRLLIEETGAPQVSDLFFTSLVAQ